MMYSFRRQIAVWTNNEEELAKLDQEQAKEK